MKKTKIIETKYGKNKKFKNAVLIEGLPGIGFVGKIAAEFLINENEGKKIADIYSPYFNHSVIMKENGLFELVKNEIYHVKLKSKNKKIDLLVLIGDVQPNDSIGQYVLMEEIADYCIKKGVKKIYTLAGYGSGKLLKKPKVYGSASSEKIKKQMEKKGIVFGKTNGAIVGAAGLLLAFGKFKGIDGVCLLGETHGQFIDARAAKEILKTLEKIFEVKFKYKNLNSMVRKTEDIIRKIEEEVEKQIKPPEFPSNSYIR